MDIQICVLLEIFNKTLLFPFLLVFFFFRKCFFSKKLQYIMDKCSKILCTIIQFVFSYLFFFLLILTMSEDIHKSVHVCGGHLGFAQNGAHSRRPACLRAEFETTLLSPSVVQILELYTKVNKNDRILD